MRHVCLALLGMLALTPSVTSAAVSVVFEQVGNDVVARVSGTADISDLGAPTQTSSGPSTITGNSQDLSVGNIFFFTTVGACAPTDCDSYPIPATSNLPRESGGTFGADAEDGSVVAGIAESNVAVREAFLVLSGGYVSGTPIMASATYVGESIASLGLLPGAYNWTWGTSNPDSLTLTIVDPNAVVNPGPAAGATPVPAFGFFGVGALVLFVGLLGTTHLNRRRVD